jgi:hypothetical protein
LVPLEPMFKGVGIGMPEGQFRRKTLLSSKVPSSCDHIIYRRDFQETPAFPMKVRQFIMIQDKKYLLNITSNPALIELAGVGS